MGNKKAYTLKLKQVTSLKKIFLKENIDEIDEIYGCKAFKGERISYQIILKTREYNKFELKYKIKTDFNNVIIRKVGYVPSECPVYEQKYDDYYLTKEPGLFPDVLYPLKDNDTINVYEYTNTTLWITIDIPNEINEGNHSVEIKFYNDDINEKVIFNVEVLKNTLPKNDLIYSQWFHTDCIASYYDVEVFSKEHWRLIDLFMQTASRTGINLLYTPIITPALDTEVGGERPTVQLVDIEYDNGKYIFEYDKLEKWINLAQKNGINNFEMAHLFTQWGAEATPKIVVKQNGKQVKKFGWQTNARSDEYKEFLRAFIPSLLQEIKKLGIDKNTYFHISDEPSNKRENDFENYNYAKSIVSEYLKDYKIIDALSNVEFYKKGLIKYPIPAINKIEPFLDEDLEERWCYYCCSQAKYVSNRFMAMPSYRTRILGIQLYLYDMIGFLHWGYNFYYSQFSKEKIDPFKTTDAKQAFPSGDAFSVYPGKDGAIESIRSVVFYEGLQDRVMLKLLENKIGKEKTKQLVNSLVKNTITFEDYPHEDNFFDRLKEKIIKQLNEEKI